MTVTEEGHKPGRGVVSFPNCMAMLHKGVLYVHQKGRDDLYIYEGVENTKMCYIDELPEIKGVIGAHRSKVDKAREHLEAAVEDIEESDEGDAIETVWSVKYRIEEALKQL